MSELLLYSCVGSGVSVCTETIFMSAHEEEISAELQYLDCLTTFVKSFQLKCCSTYRCLKTLFSILMAMLIGFNMVQIKRIRYALERQQEYSSQ